MVVAPSAGRLVVVELKRSSMMRKISGWIPSAIRGEQNASDLVVGLAVHELEDDSFIFSLCQDHRLRTWSLRVRPASHLWDLFHHRFTLTH